MTIIVNFIILIDLFGFINFESISITKNDSLFISLISISFISNRQEVALC